MVAVVANREDIYRIFYLRLKISMLSNKICPHIFVSGKEGRDVLLRSSGLIGRSFQIEPELDTSKADRTQVSPAGSAGK